MADNENSQYYFNSPQRGDLSVLDKENSLFTLAVLHPLQLFLLPFFPPSAMQQLFIGSDDQWDLVLWEPYHPEQQQISQSGPFSPSAVTPGR